MNIHFGTNTTGSTTQFNTHFHNLSLLFLSFCLNHTVHQIFSAKRSHILTHKILGVNLVGQGRWKLKPIICLQTFFRSPNGEIHWRLNNGLFQPSQYENNCKNITAQLYTNSQPTQPKYYTVFPKAGSLYFLLQHIWSMLNVFLGKSFWNSVADITPVLVHGRKAGPNPTSHLGMG